MRPPCSGMPTPRPPGQRRAARDHRCRLGALGPVRLLRRPPGRGARPAVVARLAVGPACADRAGGLPAARLAGPPVRVGLPAAGVRHRAAVHDPVDRAVPHHADAAGHPDPEPAQRRHLAERLHHRAAGPGGRRRAGRGPRGRHPVGHRDGPDPVPAAAAGGAPAGRARDRRRAAGGDRGQRQPGRHRRHDRDPGARAAVHHRVPAVGQRPVLPADRAGHRAVRPAGAGARRPDRAGHAAADAVAAGGGGAVNDVLVWRNDPLNWAGTRFTPGIAAQIEAHLAYTAIALAISGVIAFPLGLALGHTGRAGWLVSVANSLRSLPTVGLLILLYVMVSPLITGRGDAVYLVPTEIVLVLLALPAILANTYAGVRNVDPAVRDAARGMGMTGRQVLFRVELPNALPLVFSGVRSATLQVIATATIAAYVGLGGLGRYVYDGLAQRDFGEMAGGAVLVAALALLVDLLLALVQPYTVSRGVTGRFSRRADSRVATLTEL